MQILLIEDDTLQAQSVIMVLSFCSRSNEYEVIHVETIDDAQQTSIDLALLDLNIPNSPNWKMTFQQFREKFPNIPVVILVGTSAEYLEEIINAGADSWLEKSKVTPDMLDSAIRQAVARHRRQLLQT